MYFLSDIYLLNVHFLAQGDVSINKKYNRNLTHFHCW